MFLCQRTWDQRMRLKTFSSAWIDNTSGRTTASGINVGEMDESGAASVFPCWIPRFGMPRKTLEYFP